MSSNSSTSDSNVYSSDMAEATFLKRNRVLHVVQLVLSILITIASAAVIVCEVVPFRHYKSTVGWASTGLALWPLNFDLRPTIAALSCGCVIVLLNLIYVVMALIPSVCSILLHCDSTDVLICVSPASFPHQAADFLCLHLGPGWLHHRVGRRSLYHLPPVVLLPERLHRERNPQQLDL